MVVSTRIGLEAPAPLAPRYTLRGAADTSPPLDGHWMYGGELVTYPEPPAELFQLCDSTPASKDPGDVTSQDPFNGFLVFLSVGCTTRGLDHQGFRDRARTAFQVYEDAAAEDQFWNGTIDTSIPHLTDAGVHAVTTTAVNIVEGFARLEQELADAQQSGIIHCSPRIGTHASHANLVERDGALLRTRLGTIVVPGMGYDGSKPAAASAPAAGTEYAYVTNAVRMLRAPDIQLLGSADVEAIDRTTNDFTIIVEREYLIAWDGAVQGAALIDPASATP